MGLRKISKRTGLGGDSARGASTARRVSIRAAVAERKLGRHAEAFVAYGICLEDVSSLEEADLDDAGIRLNRLELKKLTRWQSDLRDADALFARIDTDRSGTLSVEEVRDYLIDEAPGLLNSTVDLFEMLDVNRDGQISNDEFRFQFARWVAATAQARAAGKLRRTDADIREAVGAWLADRAAAERKYGHIRDWDTSAVTNMDKLFYAGGGWVPRPGGDERAATFNDDIGGWDVRNVRSMIFMFHGAEAFDQPIERWNVSKVTNMERMFNMAASFNQPLERWDVSSVTDMSGMFQSAYKFSQPLGRWDVSNVTDMGAMFGMSPFNQPLERWDVSSVTNMTGMFCDAPYFNQPLERWNVSNVTSMINMFGAASAFDQPLERWDVSSVKEMQRIFNSAGMSQLPSWRPVEPLTESDDYDDYDGIYSD